jgi:hypothetical protein
MAQDAGHNVKPLSERIGHADTSITMKIYTHRSQGAGRPLAQAMGDLIERPPVTDLVTRPLDSRSDDDDSSAASTD